MCFVTCRSDVVGNIQPGFLAILHSSIFPGTIDIINYLVKSNLERSSEDATVLVVHQVVSTCWPHMPTRPTGISAIQAPWL